MSPRVSFTLPTELLEELDLVARSLDASRSEVIRQALVGHLAGVLRRKTGQTRDTEPGYFPPERGLTIADELQGPERPGLQVDAEEDG